MAFKIGEFFYELFFKKDKFTEGTEETEKEVVALEKRLKDSGQNLSRVGSTLTKSVTVPLLAVATAATKVSMDFNHQMSAVAAISRATGSEFDDLRQQALDLGAGTKFSATQAAEGMEALARAGFSSQEILASMPGLLDLASAGNVDLGFASESAASAIRAFKLEAGETTHVADVFAEVTARTQSSVGTMSDALAYIAPNAADAGWALEETAAAIGLLSDVGIKGSMAGTTLRTMLSSLSAPTEAAATWMSELGINVRDSSGEMKPLSGIVKAVSDGIEGLDGTTRSMALSAIFGQRAVAGMNALMAVGPEVIDELTESLIKSDGAAAQMAETMEDNLKGTLTTMMSALQGAGIALGDAIAPSIEKVADKVTELALKFRELPEATQSAIVRFGAFAALIGPGTNALGKLATTAGGAIGNFKALANVLAEGGDGSGGSLMEGFKAMTTGGKVGLAAAGIAFLMVAVNELVRALQKGTEESRAFVDETNELINESNSAKGEIEDQAGAANVLVSRLEELANKTNRTAAEQAELERIVSELNKLYPDMGIEVDEVSGKLNKSTGSMRDFIEVGMRNEILNQMLGSQADMLVKIQEAERKVIESREEHARATEIQNEMLQGQHGWLNQVAAAFEFYDPFGSIVDKKEQAVTDYETSVVKLQAAYDKEQEQQKLHEEALQQIKIEGTKFTIDQDGMITEHKETMTVAEAERWKEQLANARATQEEQQQIRDEELAALELDYEQQRKIAEEHFQKVLAFDAGKIEQTKMTAAKWKEQMDHNTAVNNQWIENLTALAQRSGEVPQAFIQHFAELGPTHSEVVASFVNMPKESLAEYVESWKKGQVSIDGSSSAMVNISAGNLSALPGVIDQVNTDTTNAIDNMGSDMQTAGEKAGADGMQSLEQGVSGGTEAVIGATETVSQGVQDKVDESSDSSYEAGLRTTKELEDGVHLGMTTTLIIVGSLVHQIQQKIAETPNGAYVAGQAVGNGMAQGIESTRSYVMSKATNIANSAISAINRAIDARSPSRKSTWSGEMTGTGFVVGMDNTRDLAIESATRTAEESLKAISVDASGAFRIGDYAEGLTTYSSGLDFGGLTSAIYSPKFAPTVSRAQSGGGFDPLALGSVVADATKYALDGMEVNIDHRLAGRIQATTGVRAG